MFHAVVVMPVARTSLFPSTITILNQGFHTKSARKNLKQKVMRNIVCRRDVMGIVPISVTNDARSMRIDLPYAELLIAEIHYGP